MNKVVSIIFSKDRAMQLMAMLESFNINCLDKSIVDLFVIFKCTSCVHQRQYDFLQNTFRNVTFVKESCLADDINNIIEHYKYIFFQVDDNIVTGNIQLSDAIQCIESVVGAIGFSFRLGLNTNYCYMLRSNQRLPEFEQVNDEIIKFDWTKQEFDFGYPLEVSSSIYLVSDIKPYMTINNLTHLVMVEGTLNINRGNFESSKPYLCCYKNSRIFSLPLNNTSGAKDNRAGECKYYAEDDLANLFDSGKRIKVDGLVGLHTNSCHQEFPITFIDGVE